VTTCSSESKHPSHGLGWRPPRPIPTTIDTPRLTIRLVRIEEIPAACRVVADNTDHLLPWMPWARLGEPGVAKHYSEQLAHATQTDKLTELGLGIFLKTTGGYIGATGIHDIRPDTASAETGYWIARDHTGRGYAEEACRHVLSWAFRTQSDSGMGLRRVRVYCSSANKPSQRIPEKLGLTAEVMQRQDYYVEGIGPTDRLGWGVLADEWDCSKHAARQ
jgi:RimJ/RimL family protein N-acetyltransferase